MNQKSYSPSDAYPEAQRLGAPVEKTEGFKSLDEQVRFSTNECIVCNSQPGCVKAVKLAKCSATSALYWNENYLYRDGEGIVRCNYKNKELPKE